MTEPEWSPQVGAVLEGVLDYDALSKHEAAIVRAEWDRRIAERAASLNLREILAARGQTTVALYEAGDLGYYVPDGITLTSDQHDRWLEALRQLPTTLALDLEGTLVSNAVSLFPRPGLHAFLDWAHGTFERVVLYTSVPTPKAKPGVQGLADEGVAPAWFGTVEIFDTTDGTKDLRAVVDDPTTALLLDDQPTAIPGDQRDQWVPIRSWDSPYSPLDTCLIQARLWIGYARWRAVLNEPARYRTEWALHELEWSPVPDGPYLCIDDAELFLRRLALRAIVQRTSDRQHPGPALHVRSHLV